MSRQKLFIVLHVVLFLGLTACGGGGGGGGGGGSPDPDPGPGPGTTDTTPDAFTFAPVIGVAPGLVYESEAVTLEGFDATLDVAVEGGEYALNGGAFTADASQAKAGDSIVVRLKAADALAASTKATVSVGDVDGEFAVTTGMSEFALDVVPGKLEFSWDAFDGVTHYRLLENPDGVSGFAVVNDEITGSTYLHPVSVHLTDWINARYQLEACNASGCATVTGHESELGQPLSDQVINYLKASNTGENDFFGGSIALSIDGRTLVVGVPNEDSAATGVCNDSETCVDDQADDSASNSGAVYVFVRDESGQWSQQAYIKASNAEQNDRFGGAVALSADGTTLVVGAENERSAATGVNCDDPAVCESDNSESGSGAVYVFVRDEIGKWSQQAYIKASNSGDLDKFGEGLALSADGAMLAVGATGEDSNATGVFLTGAAGEAAAQGNNSLGASGAVYIFSRDEAGEWAQEAYIKASISDGADFFGRNLSLVVDAETGAATLAVGVHSEDSAANGVFMAGAAGETDAQNDDSAVESGAVYVFERDSAGQWSQQAYIKASNAEEFDFFGTSIALSADGSTLVVGASNEDSAATGVNCDDAATCGGDPADNSTENSGAVYVFVRDEHGNWIQQTYIKASDTDEDDYFGNALALSSDGITLAVGSYEDSAAVGVGGDQEGDNSAEFSGAVYVFKRDQNGAWAQRAYVKASNTEKDDFFGVALTLSENGTTLAVGATSEDSAATGIGGEQENDDASESGAVYVY